MSEFARGDYVRKKSGAFWEGVVVGHYSTEQTPDGVAVQLFGWEDGPVQIYPASALEPCDPTAGRLATQFLTVNLSEDELAEVQVAVRNSAPGKITVATPPPSSRMAGWQGMASAPRDGTHILAILYREATSDMDDRHWPAFSEMREIWFKPYRAFGMELPWHAGDPFEEPSGIGSEHMGEGVPIAWQALPAADVRALATTEGSTDA